MKPVILPDFLKPQDGPCLSVYLPQLKDSPSANREYLEQVKCEVRDLMQWTHDRSTIDYFVDAIDRVIENSGLSENPNYHTAIFISEEGKWDLKFSGHSKPFFALANSFHIKPLLRYLHRNRKFFAIRFDEDRATLYMDGPNELKTLDTFVYSDQVKKDLFELAALWNDHRDRRRRIREFIFGMSEWVSQDLLGESAPLFVSGNQVLANMFIDECGYRNVMKIPVTIRSVREELLFAACKLLMSKNAESEERTAVESFLDAEEQGLGLTDISQIAKQAVRNNVSLLMVAKDSHIWGELNRDTGDIRLHSEQISDLDDDLLDDLCEVALSNRVKVLVLEKKKMPLGFQIAAICKNPRPTAIRTLREHPHDIAKEPSVMVS